MRKISAGTITRYSRRESEPRRWAWWFGIPFLALGALTWVLHEERLVAPTMVLLGASGVAFALDGVRTGVVEVKFGTYSRLRHPISFWFHVVVFFLLGIAILVAAGGRLLATYAG